MGTSVHHDIHGCLNATSKTNSTAGEPEGTMLVSISVPAEPFAA